MPLDTLPPPNGRAQVASAEAKHLADLFDRRISMSPGRRAWRSKKNGQWVDTTWAQAGEQTGALASWLVERGIDPGNKILIIGSTRAEWCICDLAGQRAGLVTIGAYPTLTAEQLAYVIDHSDARVVFVEGAETLARVRQVRQQCPGLDEVVVWDAKGIDDLDDVLLMSDLLETEVDADALEARASAIEREAVAIIVYTSGTTGPPKGAMITHANILAFQNIGLGVEFGEDEESLSFLPMAHVAERIAAFYTRVNYGLATAFASSIPAVLDELAEVRPTFFGSVPRIFEKAYDRIMARVEQGPAVRRRLFRWAERVGLAVVDHWQAGTRPGALLMLQYAIADRIVFSKIRAAFGGRVRFFITGAAPIPKAVLRFFWAAGMRVFEGYGQTESTVLTHINRPGATRLGSVGQPLGDLEQRLADDKEVLIRGALVFAGYHKNDEATRETIDDDGWLHTGDIGRIDSDGFLYIVDRKKHIIITAGGKNLTPANIENELKSQDPMISQVHAHGDRRPYVSALVTLSPIDAIEWAQGQGMLDKAKGEAMRLELMGNPLARPDGLDELLAKVGEQAEIRERVVEAIRRGNEKLSRVESVKRVVLLDRELSLAQDEITPTLKVKRKNVEKTFLPLFDRLYEEDDFGLTVEERRG